MMDNVYGSIEKEDRTVECNNCGMYYYEELGSSLDYDYLQLMYDDDDPEKEHPFKGCGNCKTDSYLVDL